MKILLDANVVMDVIEKREPSYKDAVTLLKAVSGAERENMDFVVTRNKKDFINATVKIITPVEFLEIFSKR
jgi:hypothetical protein